MDWRHADTPVSLPVQALDHANGYLLAAAAVRGVHSRINGAEPRRARLSLARTARLLMDHAARPSDAEFRPPMDSDFGTRLEETDWGPALRLLPPAAMDGTPMHWTRPATKLGTSAPQWLGTDDAHRL